MKALKLRMRPFEVRSLCALTRMYISAYEMQGNDIAYVNAQVLKNFLSKLEPKLPYMQEEKTIGIGMHYMSLFAAAHGRFADKLPALEATLSRQIVEAVHKAVEADIKAQEMYNDWCLEMDYNKLI